MNSRNSSSVSYKIQVPVGYVFNPNEDEIYSYFIPTRIRSRKPMYGVEEIDIYEDKSPDELFANRDPSKHIYLFTRLKKKKENHTRIQRTVGGGTGTWLGQKPSPCCRVFNNGEKINIGTTRQLTYKANKGGIDEWVMHEYSINNKFLNYMLINNGRRTNLANTGANPNPENLVFCHIYNKKGKKTKKSNEMRSNEELNQQNKRKRNSNNYEDSHENVNNGFINNNNISSVQKQEKNNTMLMTNYNYVPQPILPEPLPEPQAYYPSNADQAPSLAPQGEDDNMQDYLMQNFDKMSLPEDHDVIKNFLNDYGHGDQGCIGQEPKYYPSTAKTYNQGGNDLDSLEDVLLNW